MAKDIKELLARKLAENNQRHTEATQETSFDSGRQHKKIAIANIEPNPFQPRKKFNEVDIAQLASSITELGLLQPITLRKKDDKYQVVAGERRLRACQLLGKSTIDALVMSIDDADMALLGLAENMQRQDLSDYEIGQALRYIETAFSSKKKLAETVGINREDMYRYYAYEALPKGFLDVLEQQPNLIGRAAATDIKRVLQTIDESKKDVVERALLAAWSLLVEGRLTQNKIADYLQRQLVIGATQSKAESKTQIKLGSRVVGFWQHTSSDVTIKLKTRYLTEQQQQQLQSFVEGMFTQDESV